MCSVYVRWTNNERDVMRDCKNITQKKSKSFSFKLNKSMNLKKLVWSPVDETDIKIKPGAIQECPAWLFTHQKKTTTNTWK